MGDYDDVPFSTLLGKTLTRVANLGGESIQFDTSDGESFRLFHLQSCCEYVHVEDIIGDLNDLIGSPITMADEASSDERPSDLPAEEYTPESQTWTFYKLATVKGYVTIRFYGSSNGYYSESVSFVKD